MDSSDRGVQSAREDNGLVNRATGYNNSMTVTRNRTHRIAGVERGSALLALATCFTFTAGIAAITQSLTTAAISTLCIVAGLALTLKILPPSR
ncbi:hypothetical protein ACLMAJ_24125 [Nocardia sp. KC 131]|uniref:hypothetical protein n=1 Tax=Nocardia arseniciresistens TaxID=3392119 RepID=UPI00398F59CE